MMQILKIVHLLLVLCFASCTVSNQQLTEQLQKLSHTLAQEQSLSAQTAIMREALKKAVRRNGNYREGLEQIRRADLLHQKTLQARDSLQYWKKLLQHDTTLSTTSVRRLLWKNRQAEKLLKQLNTHVDWLNSEFKDLNLPKFDLLTRLPHLPKATPYDQQQYLQLHFAKANSQPVIALFTQQQSQLAQYEYRVLEKLIQSDLSTSTYCWGCDRPIIGITTKSNIVKVGELYEAYLYINSQVGKANPRMTLNGSPISTNNGQGMFSIRAENLPDSIPLNIDQITRYWKGSITFKDRGRDTTLRIQMSYTVVRKEKYPLKSIKSDEK